MSIVPTVSSSTTSNPLVGSSSSTNLSLSGVGSGIDWQSMLTQITSVDEQTLTPYNNEIQTFNTQASAWQAFSGTLTTLQTASDALNSSSALDVFGANVSSSSSVSASSLLSASASSSAAKGNYQIVIANTAQAEKLASGSFSSQTTALNFTGTMLVNGHAVQVAATDSLQNLQSKINSADTGTTASGVTAGIVQDSPATYRLVLTSDNTGASGISLLNGTAADTLGSLGFNGSGTSIKNHVAGGAQSDGFSSDSTAVDALLGISSLSSTNVKINGTTVSINLDDTLQTIKQNLVTSGIQASIVSTTNGSQTTSRLQIAGMTSYADDNNVLQALGLVQGNRADTVGVTTSVGNTSAIGIAGSVANTSDGTTPITATTTIGQIHGYTYNSGDAITISGTAHDGTTAGPTNFAMSSTTTVQDLLNQIQSSFANTTASITSDGRIQVVDNATGTSELSVNLTSSLGSSSGTLNFGSFGLASAPVTSATNIGSIYGYTYNSGDTITISGTAHDGSTVAPGVFNISSSSTVGDLLNLIQSQFANTTASVTSDGKIQVVDNATGTSKLSVNVSTSIGSNSGILNFGSFGQVGTVHKYVLEQGEDAAFTMDGMSMTSKSNTVTNAIGGVTLNLLGADANTTLSVNVDHDSKGIEAKINAMISAYNNVISFVNSQMTYNSSTKTTGGPLFGDNTLKMVKSELQTSLLSKVGTGTIKYFTDIGITGDQNGQLSLNTSTFEQSLSSDFQSVVNLFTDSGVGSSAQFQYVSNGGTAKSGTYNIGISQLYGTGQNIAGLIDNKNATGQGNVLTLNDSSSGANGLSISYTGTSVPDSGSVTVTRGIASLINQLASSFIDPVDGAITVQQQGIQKSITGLNKKVTDMQANIDLQTANLRQEFINMDTAVAQMNSLQSYLTTQLAKL